MSFPRYPEYKDSGVEWLGEVPGHWTLPKIKHIASFCGGATPSRENLDYWNGDIPWVSPKDMKVERLTSAEESITEDGLKSCATTLLSPGKVLMVVRSGILKHTIPVAINETAVALNQDMRSLDFAPSECDPNFFLRWVQGLNDELLLAWAKQGATVESIENEYLVNTTISLPPLPEQTAIAVFLDRETAKIDSLVAEQRRLIELLKEKRQAVISHAVTKGLNPDAPMKDSGIDWLGEVPAHWEVKRTKHVVIKNDGIQMGPFGGMLLDLDSEDTGFKVYGQENTISGDFTRGKRWIAESRFRDLRNYHVAIGDLLLTRKGSLGNARLVLELPQPGIADSDTIRVRVNERLILPTFLALLFHEAGYIAQQIALAKRGAILAGLNSETIANIRIVLPPINQQQEVMAHLGNECSRLDTLTAEAQRAIDLLQERRTALISAAVTGQIDVRPFAAEKKTLRP
jgi:type I restriction enzyme S subunit